MEQLLKITTVPVKYELRIQNARLEYGSAKAEVEISRNKGGLTMRSRAVKLNIDTFEARNSVMPTLKTSIKTAAQKGLEAGYEATARFSREGNLLMRAKIGEDVLKQIFAERSEPKVKEIGLGFTPKAPADIEYQAPDLEINYEMDKLNFDLRMRKGDFEFIPGKIEFEITQRPSVEIEYIGKPIYIPPSASPDYEPVDVKI